MTLLRFGTGWRDDHGRERSLVWSSDLAAALFIGLDREIQVVRAGLADPYAVRARLRDWEKHVDDRTGAQWAQERLGYWTAIPPDPDCVLCQGEGWHAGPEGTAVPCLCGEDSFR